MDRTDADQMLAAIERELEKDPDNSEAWAAKADILYSLDMYEDAIYCCNKSLKINPNNEFTWATKCHALNELGRHDEAETALTKAKTETHGQIPIQLNVILSACKL
jgi:tetratricopeptide (TPR) repeat protein